MQDLTGVTLNIDNRFLIHSDYQRKEKIQSECEKISQRELKVKRTSKQLRKYDRMLRSPIIVTQIYADHIQIYRKNGDKLGMMVTSKEINPYLLPGDVFNAIIGLRKNSWRLLYLLDIWSVENIMNSPPLQITNDHQL